MFTSDLLNFFANRNISVSQWWRNVSISIYKALAFSLFSLRSIFAETFSASVSFFCGQTREGIMSLVGWREVKDISPFPGAGSSGKFNI